MKILVTGADGFIGSHLTEKLVRDGHDVRAFTYYNSFNSNGWLDYCSEDTKGNFEIFSGDIRDPFGVNKSVKDCEVIFHLAALIGIPYSYHSPSAYIDTNVNGTLNVLEAAKSNNISLVVHTSTSEVYGTAKYVPIDESHPLVGQSPYSASKIAADQLAYSYYSSFDLPLVIARPFNTYGPRQSARAVIPTIISQIASGKKKLKLGSVSPTRDFNFVDDTVSGFLSMLGATSYHGEVFNIGSNYEISILETIEIIMEIMNVNLEIVSDDIRIRPKNSEVERLWSNNTKIKELLNWSPNYAGLAGFREGLSKTVDWFSQPSNLQSYKPDEYNL